MLQSFLRNNAVKKLAASAFAVSVLWWIAQNSGPQEARVVLHVMERNVDVLLAGRLYHFQEMTAEPIVVRLPPGRHHFCVRRGNTVLHAETFTLHRGESLVLVAIRNQRGALHPEGGTPAQPTSPPTFQTPALRLVLSRLLPP